jgi:hypothetical protein
MATDAYAGWLQKELGDLIAGLELGDRQRHYMSSRWLEQIVWLEGKAKKSQRWYYGLRLVAIVGGIVVPALVSLNINEGDIRSAVVWTTFAVSLLVAIAVAVEGFFHYGDRWRHYRRTAETMKSLGWQFYELAGPYAAFATHGDAFPTFAATVEGLFREDVEAYVNRVTREGPAGSDAEAQPKPGS